MTVLFEHDPHLKGFVRNYVYQGALGSLPDTILMKLMCMGLLDVPVNDAWGTSVTLTPAGEAWLEYEASADTTDDIPNVEGIRAKIDALMLEQYAGIDYERWLDLYKEHAADFCTTAATHPEWDSADIIDQILNDMKELRSDYARLGATYREMKADGAPDSGMVGKIDAGNEAHVRNLMALEKALWQPVDIIDQLMADMKELRADYARLGATYREMKADAATDSGVGELERLRGFPRRVLELEAELEAARVRIGELEAFTQKVSLSIPPVAKWKSDALMTHAQTLARLTDEAKALLGNKDYSVQGD